MVLTTAFVLIVVMIPLIPKLINYITQNGMQGILDKITGFAGKILNGNAN
jgi:hypothetical protein